MQTGCVVLLSLFSTISYTEFRITFFELNCIQVPLIESVSYREGHLEGYPNWEHFIEKVYLIYRLYPMGVYYVIGRFRCIIYVLVNVLKTIPVF